MKYITFFVITFFLFSCKNIRVEVDKNQLLYSVLSHCLNESPGLNLSNQPTPDRDSITGEIKSIIKKSPLKKGESEFYIDPALSNTHFSAEHLAKYEEWLSKQGEVNESLEVELSFDVKKLEQQLKYTFISYDNSKKEYLEVNEDLRENGVFGLFQISLPVQVESHNEKKEAVTVQYICGKLCYSEWALLLQKNDGVYKVIESVKLFPNRVH